MNLATYDIIMLAVLVAATVFGALKGFAWQVASLAAIFASYFVAYEFRYSFAAWIPLRAPWNVFVAMLLLFILTAVGVWIVFQWVSKFIDRLKLREFDRQFGALLGFAKGVILCVLITLFAVTLLGERQRQTIVNSRSGYFIAVLLHKSRVVMPAELNEVLAPYLEAVDRRLEPAPESGTEQGGSAATEPSE